MSKRVIAIVFDRRPRIVATKDELDGSAPAPNAFQELRVTFEIDGHSDTIVVGENKTFIFEPVKP